MNTDENNKIEHRLERWRLILGQDADPENTVDLQSDALALGMDKTLEALYDSDRKGSLGTSSPNVNRWLGDIREYFPQSIVQVMQHDALERLGIKRMLVEPELLGALEPDVHLVGTLLSLNKILPEKTKETARAVIKKVAEDLEKKLNQPLIEAIKGALNRSVRNLRPRPNEIDWNRTIRANLKHYQPDYQTIIPEHLVGYGKKGQALKHVFLLLDQSGSMASSVVHASVMASIMASLRSLKTTVIAFDTAVVDLSDHLEDPVELLFGVQLGGGTDIHKALAYCQSRISRPEDSIILLISDLFEGNSRKGMLDTAASIKASGATLVALLALSDDGRPAYDHETAQLFAEMDIPAFSCTPDRFPELMAAAIEKRPLSGFL